MKGIIIYGNPLWGDNAGATYCDFINNASLDLKYIAIGEIEDCLKGEVTESSKARCSKDDTYDFQIGALIALMKMCGLEKSAKAYAEIFDDTAYGDALIERDKLKEEVKSLNMSICAKGVLKDKLLEENSQLKYNKSCNESTIKSLENTRDLLKAENETLKKRINELERYNAQLEDEVKIVRDAHNMCEHKYQDLKAKKVDLVYANYKLKVENEQLKLDCEKLQHGYNADVIICGGRQNGKQHKALVELFKKIDQKKVDAAYKEAYNTTLPVWQKEALRQAYEIRTESKEKTELPRTLDINGTTHRKTIKPLRDDQIASLLDSCKYASPVNQLTVDSLIEQNRAFTRKCVDEWLYKIPTKREEMWEKIFALHKESDVIIKVKREDVNTFFHEIENKIPEITWGSGVKIFETKYTIKDVYFELKSHDVIYFRLSRATKLTYTSDPHIYLYRELKIINYLPPMRWDLFEKGRLVVKVNKENYAEFCSMIFSHFDKVGVHAFNHDCKFGYFMFNKDTDYVERVLASDHGDAKEINRHKVVDWESVKPVGTPIKMEDPYDTWVW